MLDCPVGTGRFLADYAALGMSVTGVDASEEMLALARRKKRGPDAVLMVGDATDLIGIKSHDVAVCVRFLDLIPADAMRKVVTELSRVTRRAIILTIRLGDEYVPKVNTATHDDGAFRSLVSRLGWRVEHQSKIFDAGWHVMMLVPR